MAGKTDAEKTPLDIFLEEIESDDQKEAREQAVAQVRALPGVVPLSKLRTPDPKADATELIGSRFLYRGGIMLLIGPTGVGKSSLNMQLSIHLAAGAPLFGINPGHVYRGRGMRILLVQAENDEGDLAEMRDGVIAGTDDLTPEEIAQALDRINVSTICDLAGDEFGAALDGIIREEGPFDLVILDPAFAYLGGDSNAQRDVSHFMRGILTPIAQGHGVGMIIAHHNNKPLRGKEKEAWQAGDFAYLGAGSAEWVNAARAALAIQSVGSDTVYALRGAKRGGRLGWTDNQGVPTRVQYIAHHDAPGVICWRRATPEEVEEATTEDGGGRRKTDLVEVLHCIAADEGQDQGTYKARASAVLGVSPTSIQTAINKAVAQGFVRFRDAGHRKEYRLTAKGRNEAEKRPATRSWGA